MAGKYNFSPHQEITFNQASELIGAIKKVWAKIVNCPDDEAAIDEIDLIMHELKAVNVPPLNHLEGGNIEPFMRANYAYFDAFTMVLTEVKDSLDSPDRWAYESAYDVVSDIRAHLREALIYHGRPELAAIY